jgi:hypothetical protein
MSHHRLFPFGLLTVAALAAAAPAQQPSPLSQPNPQAPVLNQPAPMGAQRGTTLDLTLTGTNLADPTALWTSFPAKVVFPSENNNGKDPAKLLVRLEIPKDAPLGFHALRLTTRRGASNLRLFCIDELPQVAEADTNHSKATAQPIAAPCVVTGRADAEVSDFFKITVTAGQRLSFEVLGHRLGSAFDPQITLHHVPRLNEGAGTVAGGSAPLWTVVHDAHAATELPGGHNNDSPGAQTDCRLSYTFKEAGDYLVEVRDTTWKGGPDFFYRLRVGDFPLATAPLPMAAKRGAKVSVSFAGPFVEGAAPVEVTVPADPAVDTVWVAPKGASGVPGWPVALAVSGFDEVLEQEPNNEPAKANRVPVPGGFTGRFQEKGDVDHVVFAATKGQRLILDFQTQELYSPTEVYAVLKDAKGTQIAATNPMTPPRLDFTAPADGDYVVAVEHLHYWGGPSETYHLTVTPYEPGFSLAMFLDRYDAPQGGMVPVPVVLAGRRDYAGPIELSVVGHPGITGTATIPASAAPAPPPPNPPPPAAQLVLNVKPDVPMGAYDLVVIGKATINGKEVVEYASVKAVIQPGLGGLSFPPRDLLARVGLAVTEKPPFTLVAKFDQPEVLRGAAATLTVTATKDAGFDEEIAVTLPVVPPNVAPMLKNIPKGQTEVKLQLTPAANAAVGSFPIPVVGKAKVMNKDVTVNAVPASLVVALPFELKVEPAPVKVDVGDKAKIKVTAVRKAGYAGPISLEVRNLPANVTAPKVDIAAGQDAAEIEVTAAAAAAPGDKGDVNVLGTAPAAANQQNASANFTVSVVKK